MCSLLLHEPFIAVMPVLIPEHKRPVECSLATLGLFQSNMVTQRMHAVDGAPGMQARSPQQVASRRCQHRSEAVHPWTHGWGPPQYPGQ